MNEDQTEAPAQTGKLTINDPIDPETLLRFSELQNARLQIAERNLDLDQEKIRVARAAASVDTERQRLFEKVLMDRGLPPNAPVEIEAKTGKITLVGSSTVPEAPLSEEPVQSGAV